jgi:hypothetical protein
MSSGYLLYSLKTKVIIIPLFKGKHNMNKIFACLRNINYRLACIGDTDHCFVRVDTNRADLLQLRYKMIEQH